MLAALLALTIAASPAAVSWDVPRGGCVYLVEPGGARTRLGCSHTATWAPPPGVLWPGDLIEVRIPGVARGRVVVATTERGHTP